MEWVPEIIRDDPVLTGTLATITIAVAAWLDLLGRGWRWIKSRNRATSPPDVSPGPEVEPYYRKRPDKSSDWVVLRNEGEAIARGADVGVNEEETGRSPLLGGEYDRKLPADLEPDQETKLMAAYNKDCLPPHSVTVTWEDEHGSHYERTKTLRE